MGVQVLLGSKVRSLNATGDAVHVLDAAGRENKLVADQVLVAIGRVPHTHGLGLEGQLLAMNGRAMTLESTDGFVRVVARRDNRCIVGWQAVGAGVSELSTAFSHSLEMGATLEDVAGTIHAHATLGEAVQEATLRALGNALHI